MTQHGGPRPGQAKIGAVSVNIPRSVGCMRCTRDVHAMYSVKIPLSVGC